MGLKKVLFLPNGTTGLFDQDGKQVKGIDQLPWLGVYLKYLESFGVNVENLEITLPNCQQAMVTKIDDGNYNWKIF